VFAVVVGDFILQINGHTSRNFFVLLGGGIQGIMGSPATQFITSIQGFVDSLFVCHRALPYAKLLRPVRALGQSFQKIR